MKFKYLPFSGPVLVISLAILAAVYTIGAFELVSLKEKEKP